MLILEGSLEKGALSEEESILNELSPIEHVAHYINAGMTKMNAIKAAAKDRGISKSEMYKLVL